MIKSLIAEQIKYIAELLYNKEIVIMSDDTKAAPVAFFMTHQSLKSTIIILYNLSSAYS